MLFNKNHRLLLCAFFGIVSLVSIPSAFTVDFDALPHDEIEARQYLAEGMLDSLLWDALQPFYRKPLSVPAGELSYLKPLFPGEEQSFPDEPDLLAAYQPWDSSAVERFFYDYPFLSIFTPILLFDYHPRHGGSEIALHMNRRGYDTTAEHYGRFSYTHDRNLMGRGTADISSAAARWERRMLKWSPVASIDLKCGNVTLFSGDGLVYGYFPNGNNGESAVIDNWLYGDAATWNGVSLTFSSPRQIRGTALGGNGFFHRRISEKIIGGGLSVKRKRLHVSLTASHAEYTGRTESDLFLHGAVRWKWTMGYLTFTTAMDPYCPGPIPFSAKSVFSTGAGRAEIAVMHLPDGFDAPRSSLLRRSLRELEYKDTLFSAATLIRIQTVQRVLEYIRFSPKFDVWMKGANVFHGKAVLVCDGKRENIHGRIQLIHTVAGEEKRNGDGSVAGMVDVCWIKNIQLAVQARLFYRKFIYSSMYTAFEPIFQVHEHMTVEPLFSLQQNPSGKCLTGYGIKQRLTLFDRTTTTFSLRTVDTGENDGRQLFIDAKAVLYF